MRNRSWGRYWNFCQHESFNGATFLRILVVYCFLRSIGSVAIVGGSADMASRSRAVID